MSGDRPAADGAPGRGAPGGSGTSGGHAGPVSNPTGGPRRPAGAAAPEDVARAALNRARAGAQTRGHRPGAPVRRRPRQGEPPVLTKDRRDPQLVGDALERLAAERGWNAELSVGALVGRWTQVVGADMAEHCTPEAYEDGRLVVRTDSTAWATQLRLLVPQLLTALAREVGDDVVREVQVRGPGAASWGPGSRRVPGRGPRDTYG